MTTAELDKERVDRNIENDGQRFLLRGVNWAEYRAIIDAFGERRVRFSYDGWSLELMTRSFLHEILSRVFNHMLLVLADVFELPLLSAGSTTLDREDVERGLEPDECFYIENEPRMRGVAQIDLTVHPPPDLAVEIDVTCSSLNRFWIYAKLQIPEVWRWTEEKLLFYRLDDKGEYQVVKNSRYFPKIEANELMAFVSRRTETDTNSLMKEFREWLQKRIAENA